MLSQHIQHGWPSDKRDLPAEIATFHAYHDELVVIDDIILRETRIVVPLSMRREILSALHESHLGIVKLKQRARNLFAWPGMNAHIEEVVAMCSVCQANRKAHTSEPLMSHDIPDRPWAKVGADIFHLDGNDFLLLVDYYSKFPEIQPLRDLTAHTVIEEMKGIFARNGIPDTLMTDNARQFKCAEFREFERQWEFTHITSSPMCPQSNGQVERCIQTVKSLMKKAKLSKRDPMYAILEYRNAPLDGTEGHAPAQLLNSRLLRSKLPCPIKLLKPQTVPPVGSLLTERQHKQAHYHDARPGGKDLPPLEREQLVRFRARQDEWIRGRVTRAHQSAPRSYVIDSPRGEFRRNRKHIRATHERENERPCKADRPIADELFAQQPLPKPSQTTPPNETRMHAQNSQTHTLGNEKHLTTRSGRVSRPPDRLTM